MLNPQPGELILDVGCGTGQLTAAIASTGAEAVGVDASTDMLERARERFPDLHFLEADIRKLRLDRRFDAICSNAALHWIPEAEAAVICLRRALREGGRVVAEFGGKGNVSAVLEAVGQAGDRLGYKLTNPWYFPSPAEYAACDGPIGPCRAPAR